MNFCHPHYFGAGTVLGVTMKNPVSLAPLAFDVLSTFPDFRHNMMLDAEHLPEFAVAPLGSATYSGLPDGF